MVSQARQGFGRPLLMACFCGLAQPLMPRTDGAAPPVRAADHLV